MNVSGVLVLARSRRLRAVERALSALPGVEVHAATADGRLVVTVEEPDHEVGRTILRIQELDGVLSAALVYQQSEPDAKFGETHDAANTA